MLNDVVHKAEYLLACLKSSAQMDEYETFIRMCSHRHAFPEENVYYVLAYQHSRVKCHKLQTDYFHRFWANAVNSFCDVSEAFHSWKSEGESVSSVAVNIQRDASLG